MLFLTFGPFPAFSWELVVYSTEWTTSSKLFLAFGLVWAFSRELVGHSTGSMLFLTFGPFSAFSRELAGHLTESSTGSMLFLTFGPFSVFSRELVVYSTEWSTGSNKSPALAISAGLLSLVFKAFDVLVDLETGRAAIAGGCYDLTQVLLTHVAGCKNAWQASGHVVIRDDPAFCVGNS